MKHARLERVGEPLVVVDEAPARELAVSVTRAACGAEGSLVIKAVSLVVLSTLALGCAGSSGQAPQPQAPQAHAPQAHAPNPPTWPKPGAEVAALAKIFSGSQTWEGTMKAGALGPDSPSMPSAGKAANTVVSDGFWYVSDMEVGYGGTPPTMTWVGHLVIGWNPSAKAYTGVLVDNLGILVHLQGVLNGNMLVLTGEKPNTMMGKTVLPRFTYDFTDPNAIHFLDEHQLNGGPWTVFEESTLRRVKGDMRSASSE